MGVYYRIAVRCCQCKNRAQFDTKNYTKFEEAEKFFRSTKCEDCGELPQIYTSLSTVDWPMLGRPIWDR